jgi:eukaryotic-like serine/threonine-protein kinase
MKTKRIALIFSLFLLLSIFLSSCVGGAAASSWPGLTVTADTAYLANGQTVLAIDLAKGEETWRFPTKPIKGAGFYAPPALTEEGSLVVGGYNKTIYGLTNSGQQTWFFDQAKNSFIASPLIANGKIFAPNSDGKLYVLDQNGQNSNSIFESPHSLWAKPVIAEGCLLLAAMDHSVYCLDSQTGEVIWKSVDLGGALVDTPTLGTDGVLYVGTLGNSVVALNVRNGEVVDSFPTEGWVWSSPLLYNGRLYFGDLKGNFYTLDASNLAEVKKITPDIEEKRAIIGRPVVFDNKVYFGSETGKVYAVDPETGELVKTITVGGKIYAAPVVAGELLLVAPNGFDSVLVAFDADGNQRWAFALVKK